MKKIESRLAYGIIGLIYYDCVLLFELISGMDLFSKKNIMLVILSGLPFLIIFAPMLSNGYDEQDNSNRLFYILGAFLVLLGLILTLVNE